MNKALENGRLESIEYDSKISIPTAPLNEIVANTSKLHSVLRPVFGQDQLKRLFTEIHEMFCHELPGYFMDVTPETKQGKQKVIDDIVAFM